MITTDELLLAHLEEIERGRVFLSLPGSPDDWAHRRAAALGMIRRKSNLIPDALLNLVLVELKERTPVRLKLRRMPEHFRFVVEVVQTEIDPFGQLELSSRQLGDSMPARMPWELENLIPASEALALLLRIELRTLKYAERRSSEKARSSQHLIPRSTISDVALDLLQRCTWNYPPGEALIDLFRELLNLENPKIEYPRRMEARQRAAAMLAHNPQIGVSELAMAVRVNKSSVSRWLKQPDFQAMVKRAAEVESG